MVVRGGIRRHDQRRRLIPSHQTESPTAIEPQECHDSFVHAGEIGPTCEERSLMPPALVQISEADVMLSKTHAAQCARQQEKGATVSVSQGRSARITIRLDEQRKLCLRLLSAIENRSSQNLLADALDQVLSEISGLNELVAAAGGAQAMAI
jgi:hypothetical protein